MPGHQHPHRHGGQRYTTETSPIPAIDKAPFGTYPSYLAARLDGLKRRADSANTRPTANTPSSPRVTATGDESAEIGLIGNVVNLSAGALHENLVELADNGTWNEMRAVATLSPRRQFGRVPPHRVQAAPRQR